MSDYQEQCLATTFKNGVIAAAIVIPAWIGFCQWLTHL